MKFKMICSSLGLCKCWQIQEASITTRFNCHNRAFCLFQICPLRKGPVMNVSTTVPPCVPVAMRVTNAWASEKERTGHSQKNLQIRFYIDAEILVKCFSMFENSFLKIFILLSSMASQPKYSLPSLLPVPPQMHLPSSQIQASSVSLQNKTANQNKKQTTRITNTKTKQKVQASQGYPGNMT